MACLRTKNNTRWCRLATGICLFAMVFAWQPSLADEWIDSHDDPAPAWEMAKGVPGARFLDRERIRVGDEGQEIGAERLTYAAPAGVSAWFWRDLPAAAVIDELSVSVEARSSRPGLLVAVEVVLPRAIDPETGAPRRIVTRARPKQWDASGDVKVTVKDFRQRVQREARALRVAHPGETIDPGEAYLARVGLAVAGGGGPGRVWVRRLSVLNLVASQKAEQVLLAEEDNAATSTAQAEQANQGGKIKPTKVTLRSEGFRIDGEPFFPRIWRWRGESLETLAERGMNTVWLDQTPNREQLAEAARLRLRLIAPPPEAEAAQGPAGVWSSILAWAPAKRLDEKQIDSQLVTIERARALPKTIQRPVLAHVGSGADRWSRLVDGLLVDAPAQTDGRFSAELDKRLLGVSPATPVLAIIAADVGLATQQQLDALLGDGVVSAWLPPSDVSSAVHGALAKGVRGLCFIATEGLDGPDDSTRLAAGWLEIINRELRLIEPWLVAASAAAPLEDNASGESAGVVLHRDGVRLAIAPALTTRNHSGMVLPGVADGVRVQRLTPVGLSPWQTERVAGGLRVQRAWGAAPGSLLVCNDPRILQSLRQYTAQSGAPAAARMVEVASIALNQADAIETKTRAAAQSSLSAAKLAHARRDFRKAYDSAHAALALVESAAVARREIARNGELLSSCPLTLLPATLTDHFRLSQLLATAPRGPNRLYGGSFEDIDQLRKYGWRRPASADDGSAELLGGSEVHGERRLRLSSVPGAHPNRVGPRVVSPPIELTAGETIEIAGWARVEGSGSLKVRDSLGQQDLEVAITANEAWAPFRMLRRTSDATTLWLSFELLGDARADVDGVMIRTVRPLGVARSNSAAQPK